MQAGLRPTPPDPRDFPLGAVYSLPEIAALPASFVLPHTVKDQRDTDFCTAFMTCAMSEVQEGVELEPAYSFALAKKIQGDVDEWGCDLRSALKAHTQGALPKSVSPFSLDNQTPNYLRRIEHWDVPQTITAPHRKKSYFKVTGPYDHFDNIRASIYKFGSPVGIGVEFGWSPDTVLFDTITSGFGHAMTVIGFQKFEGQDVCVLLNSLGTTAGLNGTHYITRDVLNHFVEKYSAYMFTDLSKEDAQYHLDTNTHADDNWIITLIRSFFNLFRN